MTQPTSPTDYTIVINGHKRTRFPGVNKTVGCCCQYRCFSFFFEVAVAFDDVIERVLGSESDFSDDDDIFGEGMYYYYLF